MTCKRCGKHIPKKTIVVDGVTCDTYHCPCGWKKGVFR